MDTPIRQHPSVPPALLFLAVAALAFAYHIVNGEEVGSGLIFFMMTAPWGWLLPDSLTSSPHWDAAVYPMAWFMILENALVLGWLRGWYVQSWRDRLKVGTDLQQ